MKKTLALLMALCMVFAVCAASAFADDPITLTYAEVNPLEGTVVGDVALAEGTLTGQKSLRDQSGSSQGSSQQDSQGDQDSSDGDETSQASEAGQKAAEDGEATTAEYGPEATAGAVTAGYTVSAETQAGACADAPAGEDVGTTIAVDRRVISLGTEVKIDGVGVRIAQDTGVYGNTIDLLVSSHSGAYDWGVRYRDVWVKAD